MNSFTLKNDDIRLVVSPLGATVRELWVKTRDDAMLDVVLGYDTDEEYMQNDGYLGATIGRNANRLGGSKICVGERVYSVTSNENANQLHGGKTGFSHKEFSLEEKTDTRLVLSLVSPDGDEGYPGEVKLKVTYELEDAAVNIIYDAVSTEDTVVNLTNHMYFNLNGHSSGSALNHVLMIPAHSYTPANDENIPLGEIAPVSDTPLDFNEFHIVGARREAQILKQFNGYDYNYILDSEGGAAVLMGDKSKLSLSVSANRPAIQLYTANYLSERRGKGNSTYKPFCAVCLEPQFFPNSANVPLFKRMGDPTLKRGEEYHQKMTYRFEK